MGNGAERKQTTYCSAELIKSEGGPSAVELQIIRGQVNLETGVLRTREPRKSVLPGHAHLPFVHLSVVTVETASLDC